MSTPEPAPPLPVSGSSKPYRIVGTPVETTQYSEALQRVESGTLVRAQWLNGGTIVSVFVPDGSDLAATADQLIRYKGAQIDALHRL